MRWRPTAGVAVFLCLAGAERAWAGGCDSPELSGCIDSDTFWPHAGRQRLVAVGGTETLARGRVGFGLVASYQSRPIMLLRATTDERVAAIDNQLNASFLFAYGLTDRLEVDAALPITLWQDGTGLQPLTGGRALSTSAARDLRLGIAFAVVPRARVTDGWAPPTRAFTPGRAWALTARFEVAAPTGDRGQLAGDRGAVFVPTLAADYRPQHASFERFGLGLEVGARIRDTTSLLGSRVGTQMVLGLGASFDLVTRERLTIGAEARLLPTFATQADAQPSGGAIVTTPNGLLAMPAEWLVSLRSAPIAGGDFSLQLAGGGPIPFTDAITLPRARITLGVVFAPAGRDSDGDGVPDRDDRCPSRPGVPGGDGGLGCPRDEQPTPTPAPALALPQEGLQP